MNVECPSDECTFDTESEHGLSVHFGSQHDGSLEDYGFSPEMTDEQRDASSQYDRPSKEKLQEWSDRGHTFKEIANNVNEDATRHVVSHWFDVYGIEHQNQGQIPSGDGKYRNEEWLKKQLDSGKSVTEIANGIEAGYNTVEKWVNRFGIDYTPENKKPAGNGRYRDSGWLQEKHDEYDDQQDIAEECGASLSTVNTWAKIHEIDYESRHERQIKGNGRYREEDFLRQKYLDEEMSLKEIGRECGVCFATVRYWINRYDIETREFSTGPEDGPQWWRKTEKWHQKRREIRDRDGYECQECSETDDELHVHHITPVSFGGDKFDPSNLVLLCESCHYGSHMNPGESEWIEVSE